MDFGKRRIDGFGCMLKRSDLGSDMRSPGRRYLALYGLAWVAFLAGFTVYAYWADRDNSAFHENLFNEQQSRQVELASQGIEDRFDALVNRIRADADSMMHLRGGDREWSFDAVAKRLIGLAAEVKAVGLWSPDTSLVIRTAKEADPAGAPWRILEETALDLPNHVDSSFWMPPFDLTPDSQLAAIAMRIDDGPGRRDSSWLLVAIDLRSILLTYVAPMRVGQYGAGYALDSSGRIAYDHEAEVVGRSVFDGMHDKYPLLLDLDRQMIAEPVGVSEYSFTVERGGEVARKLIAWRHARAGERTLVVALSTPDTEINAPMAAQRRTFVIAGALLIAGLIGTTVIFFLMRQRLLSDSNQDLVRKVADRTRRLEEEVAARATSESRVRDFAETASDWFWETDADLRFTYFSERNREITGFDPSIYIGKTRREIAAEGTDTQKWESHFDDLDNHRAFRDFTYDLKRPRGARLTISISGKPHFDKKGRFLGFRGTGRDVSKQKLAEEAVDKALEQARDASRAKSDFLATMSHELRTPLNAIIGFSDMMRGDEMGDLSIERYQDYSNAIHASGRHLLALVNDILDIASIEAGKRSLAKTDIDVEALLRETVQGLGAQLESKQIQVSFDIQGNLPALYVDERSYRQIVLNLLSNSIKFSRVGGAIEISAFTENANSILIVEDRGVGISGDRLETITEPFSKGGEDPLLSEAGTGLGLSIVKSLVELHDGRLGIASALGKGTRVTVSLPMVSAKAGEAA